MSGGTRDVARRGTPDAKPTHVEPHSRISATVRDIVIGMSDGLTVPFALAAGLSGAVEAARVVVVAGLAEIAAGSLAMGLGGYLAARTEAEHYAAERRREEREVRDVPDREAEEVEEILQSYGVPREAAQPVVEAMRRDTRAWVDFMMRFELDLAEPEPRRALESATTIALSYAAGGLVPLLPYFFVTHPLSGLWASVGLTALALFGFGFAKGRLTGAPALRSAGQTTLVGGLAAAAAFLLAKAIA